MRLRLRPGWSVALGLASKVLGAGEGPADPVQDWLRVHALPIRSLVPGTPSEDLRALDPLWASARIVGLGEATHGTGDFIRLRHRITRHLALNHGYGLVVLECGFAEAYGLDAFVQGGQGDPEALLNELDAWPFNTREFLEFLHWTRAYNELSPPGRRISLRGVDVQDPRQEWSRLRGILATWRPGGEGPAPSLEEGCPLFDLPSYARVPSPQKAALRDHLRRLRAWILAWPGTGEHPRGPEALRLCENLILAERHGSDPDHPEARETGMTDNLVWHQARAPQGKVVLWAHNRHVQAVADSGIPWLGSALRKRFGGAYRPVGLFFGEGRFLATETPAARPKAPDLFPAPPLRRRSLEAVLQASTAGSAAWDLRVLAQGPCAEWLGRPLLMRSIGTGYDPQSEEKAWLSLPPHPAFDGLIYLRRAEPSSPLFPLNKDQPAARPSQALPQNLHFEEGEPGVPPWGWRASVQGPREMYRHLMSLEGTHSGKACGLLESMEPASPRHFANLSQSVDPTPFRGRKVRLRAWVRAEPADANGRAQLWVRVDRRRVGDGFFDNMDDRPIRDPAWRPYTVEGFVDPDAVSLHFGMILVGEGRAWIDDLSLEAAD